MQTITKVIGLIATVLLIGGCATSTPAPIQQPAKPPAVGATPVAPAVPATAAPAAIATVAPTATAAPAVKIKRGGTLRVGNAGEYQPNLDPHQITGPCFGFDTIFSNLIRVDIDTQTGKYQLKGGLAESWEQPNPKTIVMKLRKGVTFHDKSGWNAETAKWNLDRMKTHPKAATKTDLAVLETVEIVDDFAVRLNLKGAPAGLLERLSDGFSIRAWMMSKAAADKNGDDWLARNPVGSGPMQFVEWKPGDQMTVKKWDGYWDKGADGQPLPYLDGIVFRLILDETVRTTELRTGNIELATGSHPRNFPALKAEPKLDMVAYPWNAMVHYIIFNNKQDPTKNVKVRQAALYAIDREAMAKAIGMGVGSPTYYWWSSSDLGYDDTLPRYSYQPEKATQLLKDAGYAGGIDITNAYMGTGFLPSTSEALKSMWDKIGIRTTLEVMERTAFVPKLQTANFQVATSTRDWGAADPDDYSFRLITGGAFNFAHFENPEFDKCMAEGRDTAEPAKRAETYKRCQRILIEQVPYGEVWHYPKNVVFARTLKGWQPHLFNMTRLAEAWLDK